MCSDTTEFRDAVTVPPEQSNPGVARYVRARPNVLGSFERPGWEDTLSRAATHATECASLGVTV
jgi:hypothetical protein